jgi:hypothetical protein
MSQIARKIEFNMLSREKDANIPNVNIQMGYAVRLFDDNEEEIFRGYIMNRQLQTEGIEKPFRAYDNLYFLTKSKVAKNWKGVTAEAATAALCAELGVKTGKVSKTGISQDLKVISKTAYEAIVMLYEAAGKKNGKKYIIRSEKGLLNVYEIGEKKVTKELHSSKDVISSTYTESIENIINRVLVSDEYGNISGKKENKELLKYGIFQEIVQKADEAEKALKDIERTGSLECWGNAECITGNAVNLRQESTNMVGVFDISSDTHTWENGKYKMSLNLDYKGAVE